MFSQKTSTAVAIPWDLTSGSMVWVTRSIYPSGLPLNSSGSACAPRNVASMCRGNFLSNCFITSRIFNSVSRFSPYPDLISRVVIPCFNRVLTRFDADVKRLSFEALRLALTVEKMPPPCFEISS